ncbi:MAG: GNAT family N-acetyltransferase [Rhodobacteraceae bacterium]|nr:GNAT family N-acetyltransferase [Paracoccaceae bacterium]
MTPLPHERPIPGAAQSQAQSIAARVPVLRTTRLTLRAPRIEDFAAYAGILTGPRAEAMGERLTRAEAWSDWCRLVGLWLLRGHGVWTLETADDETAGFVLIGFEPGDQEPELGWFLTAEHEGRGLAEEAARAVLAHAWGTLVLDTLVSYIAPGNHRSLALARRLGARRDGTHAGCEVWRHFPGAIA